MTDFKDAFNRWRLLKVYTREQNPDLGKKNQKNKKKKPRQANFETILNT